MSSWKDSRHITDDSSCYLYSCHKIFLCFHGSLVHQGFHVPPEMEIKSVRSGVRGGQTIGPPRPINLLPKVSFKWPRTTWSKCVGAPSFWNHIARRMSKDNSSSSLPPVSEVLVRKQSLDNFNLHCLLYSFPSFFGLDCLRSPQHFRDTIT